VVGCHQVPFSISVETAAGELAAALVAEPVASEPAAAEQVDQVAIKS
jgi:hypothetical protein